VFSPSVEALTGVRRCARRGARSRQRDREVELHAVRWLYGRLWGGSSMALVEHGEG